MFYPDKPIIAPEGDLLNRRRFSQGLASYISEMPMSASTVIGVAGPWGCGKTSLINMALKQLPDDANITIAHYNPWNIFSEDVAARALFAEILLALKKTETSKAVNALGRVLEGNADEIGAAVNAVVVTAGGGVVPPGSLVPTALKRAGVRQYAPSPLVRGILSNAEYSVPSIPPVSHFAYRWFRRFGVI